MGVDNGSVRGGITLRPVAISVVENLRISFSLSLGLSLVKTVDSCVASGEGSGVSRGEVGAGVVAMAIGKAMGVPIGGVKVQRVGFRLGQAKRGNGENYDLCIKLC